MSLRIVIEPAARLDIASQFEYLTDRNSEAAIRYYDAANETFVKLAESPGIGTLLETDHPALSGIRRFPVPGFRKYLIFYRATQSELRIIRVLHGARNIRRVLEAN